MSDHTPFVVDKPKPKILNLGREIVSGVVYYESTFKGTTQLFEVIDQKTLQYQRDNKKFIE